MKGSSFSLRLCVSALRFRISTAPDDLFQRGDAETQRILRLLLLTLCFSAISAAQSASYPIQFGVTMHDGIECEYETHLDPPSPALAGNLTGGIVSDSTIHRFLAYSGKPRTFFGYDLVLERAADPAAYRVTFRPLTITPEKVDLDEPSSWHVVPLPGYPKPQIVHASETIALDLFTNTNTGQKITDYLTFHERGWIYKPDRIDPGYKIQPGDMLSITVSREAKLSQIVLVSPDGNIDLRSAGEITTAGMTPYQLSVLVAARLAMSAPLHLYSHHVEVQVIRVHTKGDPRPPHDFSVQEAELRLTSPRITCNGRTFSSSDAAAGPTVWFYIPGQGRYTLSLTPRGASIKAGTIRGKTLIFTIPVRNLSISITSETPIAPGAGLFNLYVSYNPAWIPADPAERDAFLIGPHERTEVRLMRFNASSRK